MFATACVTWLIEDGAGHNLNSQNLRHPMQMSFPKQGAKYGLISIPKQLHANVSSVHVTSNLTALLL